MQFYAATVVTVFTLLFSVLYLVPPVRNLAYFLSLSVVLVIASHYTTVCLLYLLAYKTVTPKGKVVVVTRCDSGYGNRLAIELDRRGFTVRQDHQSSDLPSLKSSLLLLGYSLALIAEFVADERELMASFHALSQCSFYIIKAAVHKMR